MTAENPENWTPDDGAGYIPTEEGGSEKEARIRKLEERQRDMVHKADLRELIEQWREFAAGEHFSDYGQGVQEAVTSCADELEDLIE